ncbi:S_2TMBeta domain-containing protein [Vibrio chagasii]|nr:S_2TMBeta domain-containing protein [Vibrio chagasii]
MFRVVRFDLLLKFVVLLSIFIAVGIYVLAQKATGSTISIFKLTTIATVASTVIMFLVLSPTVSRFIWSIIRLVKRGLYPDLNGVWVGQVITENEQVFEVRAVIKQALLVTEIDMHGETVKSVTLETTPTRELNQNKLYYVYRSTPKNPSWGDYIGSTIFDVIEDGASLTLSGKYYTDRKSVGRISIKRVSKSINADVSYY